MSAGRAPLPPGGRRRLLCQAGHPGRARDNRQWLLPPVKGFAGSLQTSGSTHWGWVKRRFPARMDDESRKSVQ